MINNEVDMPDSDISLSGSSEDVHRLKIDDREVILVGTAHISRESVNLVRQVIVDEQPDSVCIELDERRYKALSGKKRWESLDLKQIIGS